MNPPSEWSEFAWNDTHQCYSRYRWVGPNAHDYEYDYQPATQTEVPLADRKRRSSNSKSTRPSESSRHHHGGSGSTHKSKSKVEARSHTSGARDKGKKNEEAVDEIANRTRELSMGQHLWEQRLKNLPTIRSATKGSHEEFDSTYRKHSSHKFRRFRIFKILWSEPNGSTADSASNASYSQRTVGAEQVFAKVRRFLIIDPRKGHCLCLPISTYLKQGVLKHGVHAEDHTIIFSSDAPYYLDGEIGRGMTRDPIRAVMATQRDKLEPESRLNVRKVYTVEHNVKVWFIGEVHPDWHAAVTREYNAANPPLQLPVQGPLPQSGDTVAYAGGVAYSQLSGNPSAHLQDNGFSHNPVAYSLHPTPQLYNSHLAQYGGEDVDIQPPYFAHDGSQEPRYSPGPYTYTNPLQDEPIASIAETQEDSLHETDTSQPGLGPIHDPTLYNED